MREDAALLLIKKKIVSEFDTLEACAAKFKVTTQGLDKALKGKQKKIPNYLLEFAGLELQTTYHKVTL